MRQNSIVMWLSLVFLVVGLFFIFSAPRSLTGLTFVEGNESNITSTGISSVAVTINDAPVDPESDYSGSQPVVITDSGAPIVAFPYDFDNNVLNFSSVVIEKSSDGLAVSGIDANKTFYFDSNGNTNVCINDEASASLGDISADCTGAGEVLVPCDGSVVSSYSCIIDGSGLIVSGLLHSAVKGITITSENESENTSILLSSVSPSSVYQAANVELAIEGANFAPEAVVSFSSPSISITSTVISPTEIKVNISVALDAEAGSVDITVTQGNESVVLEDNLTIVDGPFDSSTVIISNTTIPQSATVEMQVNITTAPGVDKSSVNISSAQLTLVHNVTNETIVLNASSIVDPEGTFTITFEPHTFIAPGTYLPTLSFTVAPSGFSIMPLVSESYSLDPLMIMPSSFTSCANGVFEPAFPASENCDFFSLGVAPGSVCSWPGFAFASCGVPAPDPGGQICGDGIISPGEACDTGLADPNGVCATLTDGRTDCSGVSCELCIAPPVPGGSVGGGGGGGGGRTQNVYTVFDSFVINQPTGSYILSDFSRDVNIRTQSNYVSIDITGHIDFTVGGPNQQRTVSGVIYIAQKKFTFSTSPTGQFTINLPVSDVLKEKYGNLDHNYDLPLSVVPQYLGFVAKGSYNLNIPQHNPTIHFTGQGFPRFSEIPPTNNEVPIPSITTPTGIPPTQPQEPTDHPPTVAQPVQCTVKCVAGMLIYSGDNCPPNGPIDCYATYTGGGGIPASVFEAMQLDPECCPSPTGKKPPCKGTAWACDDKIPGYWRLSSAEPCPREEWACADIPGFLESDYAPGTTGKDVFGADFDACCPGKVPPYDCVEDSYTDDCAFVSSCCDPLTGMCPESDIPKRWIHDRGVGSDYPCPYDYCSGSVDCTCEDMLGKYGACGSSELAFASLTSTDAFMTNKVCCGACEEGVEKPCYTGPADTDGVPKCKPGVSTCVVVESDTGPVTTTVPTTWGCMPKVTTGGSNAGKTCYEYHTGTNWAYVCNSDCLIYGCQAVGTAGPSSESEEVPPPSPSDTGGQLVVTDICVPETTTTRWTDCIGEVLPDTEVCNGIDDNCNRAIDEGFDIDGDGVPDCSDCGPTDPAVHGSAPIPEASIFGTTSGGIFSPESTSAAPEICDGVDNNCDGSIDEGCPCPTEGQARTCGPPAIGVCQPGSQTCTNGVWSNCNGAVNPVTEICGNGVDENCNGAADDGCPNGPPTPTGVNPPPPPPPPPPDFPPPTPPNPPVDPRVDTPPPPPTYDPPVFTPVVTPTLLAPTFNFEPVPDECVYVESSSTGVSVDSSGDADFPADLVPDGYTLIDTVSASGCSSRRISLTRSISNIWKDVHVIACEGGVCETVTDAGLNEEMTCGGKTISELFNPQLTSRETYMDVEDMESIVGVGQEITESDRSISTGNYDVEFTGALPGVVGLQRPDSSVMLPQNSCLGASGAPLVVSVKNAVSPMPVVLTMPVVPIKNADPHSYRIYAWHNDLWDELESTYNPALNVITADIEDITIYLNENKEALFLVAGLTCHALEQSCVTMSAGGNDEVNVLVHGFTSSIDTWWPLVKQAEFDDEKYDWVGYAYPPSDTTETAAVGLRDCLNTLGKYKKINFVSHSVGGQVTLKALDLAYQEKEKYTAIYNVNKVISLGLPYQGLDVKAVALLAKYLAAHRTLARAFDRDSAILDEITAPAQEKITPVPPWAKFIAVAGTEECDYTRWLFTEAITGKDSVGAAIAFPEALKEFILSNDCLVTVQNAVSYLDAPKACSNVFTPNVWHPKLNDRADARRLIMYLLNIENAQANPELGFEGVNQYVAWDDICQEGKTYAIVGKRSDLQYPLFCNCGNDVCEPKLGEDITTCPSDCGGRRAFLCNLFDNLSNFLLFIFGLTFIAYLVRKYVVSKKPPMNAWRIVLWAMLIAIVILLLLILFYCKNIPLISLLLAALFAVLLFFELFTKRKPEDKLQDYENYLHDMKMRLRK